MNHLPTNVVPTGSHRLLVAYKASLDTDELREFNRLTDLIQRRFDDRTTSRGHAIKGFGDVCAGELLMALIQALPGPNGPNSINWRKVTDYEETLARLKQISV
jgi:hypothetical protein